VHRDFADLYNSPQVNQRIVLDLILSKLGVCSEFFTTAKNRRNSLPPRGIGSRLGGLRSLLLPANPYHYYMAR
jgi:hypothetical protein